MKREEACRRIEEGLTRLSDALEAGRSEELEKFLKVASRFHRYSFGNLMLILMQCPEAEHVAGYSAWQELGRQVKKGETGIGILAPMRYRKKGDDGDEEQEGSEVRGFKVVHVFDISQTEGEEVFEFTAIKGDVAGTELERLESVIETHDIELVTGPLPIGTYGLSHGGKITIREGLSRAERLSVLVHEFSHELLHRGPSKLDASKQVKECEAEAIASVVLTALGVDSSTRSADYIQLYRGDTETLGESLELIQKTALFILEQIEAAEVKAPSEQNADLSGCKHTLYLEDTDSTWIGERVEDGTRYSCSVCGRFYGFHADAKPQEQATEEADAEQPAIRIGRADYEERRQDRIERYEQRAEKARTEANATYSEARQMAGAIPFGQPILVGHHSEQRDRNYRNRIHNKFGKSFELADKAKHYESKAASAESNHIISSDDPEALAKLQSKLESLQAFQEQMKTVNAAWRKAGKPKPKDEDGWSKLGALLGHMPDDVLEGIRAEMSRPWHIYDAPYPPYALGNNSSNMRRIKERIAQLEREGQVTECSETQRGICRVRENTEINRIQLFFDSKPAEQIRKVLKQHGFRWSRREGAWQRLLNDAGRRAVDWALAEIGKELSNA